MVDINELRLLVQDYKLAGSPVFVQVADMNELLDRIETAEKECAALRTESAGLVDDMNLLRDNNTALRARIEAMERQEPVAWCATDETGTVIEALGMNQSRRFDTALYLAPGAQPAPSVPEAVMEVIAGLVREVERNTCLHEETHRGGFIWEICDICGAKWADDEGGKPEFKWPDVVEKARAMLAAAPEAKP